MLVIGLVSAGQILLKADHDQWETEFQRDRERGGVEDGMRAREADVLVSASAFSLGVEHDALDDFIALRSGFHGAAELVCGPVFFLAELAAVGRLSASDAAFCTVGCAAWIGAVLGHGVR